MDLIFKEAAATEAVAQLLRQAGGRTNRLAILHLLYFAERRALSERGIQITGARAASTASGPVLVEVWNLAHGTGNRTTWQNRIRAEGDDLTLIAGADTGELSHYATRTLWSTYAEIGRCSLADLTQYLREHCPEWAGTGHAEIPTEDILRACGKTDLEIQDISEDAAYYAAVQRIFSR